MNISNAIRTKSLAIVLCALLLGSEATAQRSYLISGRRFDRQLDLPGSIFWSDVPVKDAFDNLSTTRRLAVWIDRRCDTNQLLSFGANLPRLKDCLWKLAEQHQDLDVAWSDDIVYVGPPETANRFATIHEIHRQQLQKLPADQRTRWSGRTSGGWDRLSSPTEIVAALESELGMEIKAKDKVLHDLWPAHPLPSLPLFQRLELLLSGFDLTFVFEEQGGAKIIPMPSNPQLTGKLTIPKQKREEIETLLAKHPKAELTGSTLKASWRVHELVERVVSPPPTNNNLDLIRYTLRAENQPLGTFVRSLCKQLDIECEFIDVSNEKQESRISFDVKRADLRTLFGQIVRPAGLQFELNGKKLTVRNRN